MTTEVEELRKQLEIAEANGNLTVKDNRYHLEVDPKQVETWELGVLESARVLDWLLVFSRYLANGSGLVSPGLPTTPLDELTDKERQEIMSSKAYKALKHFKMAALKSAVESFQEQITAGF